MMRRGVSSDGIDNVSDELAEADVVHHHAVEEGEEGETTSSTTTATAMTSGGSELGVDSSSSSNNNRCILPQPIQQQRHSPPQSEQSDQHDGACVAGSAIDMTMSSNENTSKSSSYYYLSTNSNNNEFPFTPTIQTKVNDSNNSRGESSSSLWPHGVSDRLSKIDDDDDDNNFGHGANNNDSMASMEQRINQRQQLSTEDEQHEEGNEIYDDSDNDNDNDNSALTAISRALTILPSNELSILPTNELSTDVVVLPPSVMSSTSQEITVLPSNEISTTTADAALAAETFADMILDDDNDGDLYSSSSVKNNNVSTHQPVVDGSGVIHRTHRTFIPGGVAAAAAAAVLSSTDIPTSNGGDGCGGRNEKCGGGEKDLMGFLNNEYGSAIDFNPRISVGGTISGGGIGTENGDIGMENNKSTSAADNHLSSRRGVGAGANENNNNDDTNYPTTKRGYHHHLHPRNNSSDGMPASEEDDEDDNDEEEEEEDSSEISASDEDDASWISWFCNLRGNEYFVEVDEDYIQDDFNLTGLNWIVPYYHYALDMILDVEMPMEDRLTEEEHEIVESAAEMLYGMVHARYIVTNRGMHVMYEKYRAAAFGRCPQVYCQGQPVLPVGLSDMPRSYTVNVFCPRCHGLYFPKSTRQANIDGAYFGTTFPHLYLITHPEIIPIRPMQQYVPRVFGFRINENSLYFRNHNNNNEDEQQQLNNNNSVGGAAALIGGEQNDNTRSGGGINSQRSGGIRR